MLQEFEMVAKTFKGLEQVLAGELIRLGANNVQAERRAVSFSGDMRLLYKANLWLRTASRILKPIATFRAKDADEVYEHVKRINWELYMSLDTTFTIDSTVYSEDFRHSKYVTYRVKDGIADFFTEKYGKRPSVRVDGADLYINVHIAEDRVTVSLDSSGASLHKRGWRVEQTTAIMNEALAAGMLLMAGWKGDTDFVDPMCGSGTFLIEAAMIALNIPPGIYRQGFAFERWRDFDRELFEELYNDDSEEREFTHHIYGSDSAYYAIRAAEKNVKSAGLQKYITLHQCPIQSQKEHAEPCLVMMNPPYGERIEPSDILKLYDEIGTVLKHKFTGSTAWVISSNELALKRIGLRPSGRVHLLNGELDCQLLRYDLFAGKRNAPDRTSPEREERGKDGYSRREGKTGHSGYSGEGGGDKERGRDRREGKTGHSGYSGEGGGGKERERDKGRDKGRDWGRERGGEGRGNRNGGRGRYSGGDRDNNRGRAKGRE